MTFEFIEGFAPAAEPATDAASAPAGAAKPNSKLIHGIQPHFETGDRDPDDARADLMRFLDRCVKEAFAYDKDSGAEPPRYAIAGAVGLGKTMRTLGALDTTASRVEVTLGSIELNITYLHQGKTVFFLVPSLKLMDEVVEQARGMRIPAVAIRGRAPSSQDPKRWPALCIRHEAATAVAKSGRCVWSTMCEARITHGDGTRGVERCGDYKGCGYIDQFQNLEGKLVVMAHNQLSMMPHLLTKPDFVIVDERFYTTLTRKFELPISEVTKPRFKGRWHVPGTRHKMDDLVADATRAIDALLLGRSMADAGISRERLEQMAELEEELGDAVDIHPGQTRALQEKLVKDLQDARAPKLAKLWRILAEDCDRVSQRVVIGRGEKQGSLLVYYKDQPVLLDGVPVLLIDADHDPLIGDATLPVNGRVAIRPRFDAEVIQVHDTACSKNRLLGMTGKDNDLRSAANRRKEVLLLAQREAAQGCKVLVVTYKPVADLLRQELAGQPIPGVEIAHFGAVRGLDRWKDFGTVIVAGREQMPPQEAENIARCLFGGDPEQLLLPGEYVEQERGYSMKDGSLVGVKVQVHPDPRVQALIEQSREREVEQAVGRLRLVDRKSRGLGPARVFLLSNLPTALAVDRLTTWKELMPGKMEQAAMRTGGVLPLSRSELVRVFRDLWPTEDAYRGWQKRQSEKGGRNPIEHIIWRTTPLSAVTRVSYRLPGQTRGSPHIALIPGAVSCPDAARAAMVPVLGEVTAVRILEAIHRPAAPEASEPPAKTPEPTLSSPANAPPADTLLVPEADEAEVYADLEPDKVASHPRLEEILSPPFEVIPLPQPANQKPAEAPAIPPARRTAGNLALAPIHAADESVCADGVSVVVARLLPRIAKAPAAAWDDDRAWTPGFLTCGGGCQGRLLHLQAWVEAAGGRMLAQGDTLTAHLPALRPGMGRAELLRFCRQLRVTVRWLDVPGGPFARGEGEFAAGAGASGKGGRKVVAEGAAE